MNAPTRPLPGGLHQSRERTIEALCRHFANDHLSVEEFERRVDRAHQVASAAALDALTRDLPVLPNPAQPSDPDRSAAADATGRDVPAPAPHPARIAPSEQSERGYIIAVMGGVDRKGSWIPARRSLAYTIWGGIVLDFREARLPPGITEVLVVAFMGGVEIIVPPGLRVESGGMAIMGGFDLTDDAPVQSDPDAPILRVNGFALLGGVEITTRLPGESERDAKRRLKEENRRRRRSR